MNWIEVMRIYGMKLDADFAGLAFDLAPRLLRSAYFRKERY